MPWAAKRPCGHPGCPRLVGEGRYCREHTREQNQGRGSPRTRGYDAEWEQIRKQVLREEPTCTIRTLCLGDPSTDVDHVVPLRRGGTNARRNLRGACHRCHSSKTVKEDGGFGRHNPQRG